jgi:NAD(P)-dependent dehydrogenase (short-subunit alcohol dehydrogenase family)
MRLRDKVTIITGSGGAIGSVTAKRFAREGAKVAVTDINQKAGKKTVEDIRDNGGEAIFVGADITKVADTERLIKSVVDRYWFIPRP